MSETVNRGPETFDILGVIERVSARRRWKRIAELAGGTALFAWGLRRVSPLGLVAGALGAALALRGLTGKSLKTLAREIPDKLRGAERPARASDKVDQGSVLSFPASDPPAF